MKVAAYCRVSTDKEDQANSFESQQRYFREYIDRQPGWELYEIYADEGITGTSTQKRAAFNRMICDAQLHRFDLILTKEVSRFSRNILDAVSYTRKLRQLGIGVRFMSDGIDTLDPDAELRLSLFSSIAQEESRKTSARVKWGQTRRMEQGVVFGRSMLGYDVKNGRMTVNREGAAIVRLIFQKYVCEGKGAAVIARELEDAGYRTLHGRNVWRSTAILKILKNEKYCGDLKQKKTFTPDYLTHQKKYNHGEETFVFLRAHHEAIVDRALWDAAQRELARRDLNGKTGSGHGNRYPMSGKIKCGVCGKSFVSRGRKRRDGIRYRTWRCGTAVSEGTRRTGPAGEQAGCGIGYQIRDELAVELVKRSVGMLRMDRETVVSRITDLVLHSLRDARESEQAHAMQCRKEQKKLQEKKKSVLDAFFSGIIGPADMQMMNEEYDRRIAVLNDQIMPFAADSWDSGSVESDIRRNVWEIVSGRSAGDRFYGNLVDHITAYPGRRVTVQLKQLPACWSYLLKPLPDV